MSVLSDGSILQRPTLVTPFHPKNVGPASIDMTLSNRFVMVEGHKTGGVIRMDTPVIYVKVVKDEFVLPAKQFVLASTAERVKLPADICAEVSARSSIGRLGLFTENAGWIDPGFEGHITLELFNANEYPILLQAGRRLCQIVFYQMDSPAVKPYEGKYQGMHADGTVGSRIFEDKDDPPVCPAASKGGHFAQDTGRFNECDNCPYWTECNRLKHVAG